MTEPVKTHALLKTLAALAVFGLLGFVVWPHLDQSESRVVLVGTVLTIALAFYSIFDLQEQRNERFWHTIDRLLRASFVAMTLVFVVEIAFTPEAKQPVTQPATAGPATQPDRPLEPIYLQAPCPTLADELIAQEQSWDVRGVEPVIKKHFGKLGDLRPIRIVMPGNERSVSFRTEKGNVLDLVVR